MVNVRLLLASTLSEQVETGYWTLLPDSLARIQAVLHNLSEDNDADISYRVTGQSAPVSSRLLTSRHPPGQAITRRLAPC